MSVIPTTTLSPVPPNGKVKGHTVKEAFVDDTGKQKEKSSKGKVFKVLSGFCDQTSLHGLGQVVANNLYIVKFVWVLAFLSAIGSNSYHLSNLIDNYLSYPKQQVTTTEEKPLPFPAVSICNLDTFSRSNFAEASASPLSNLHKYQLRLHKMIREGIIQEAELMDFMSPVVVLESIGTDESRQIGHKLEDFVLRCTFRGVPCNVSTDFTHFLNPLMFNCYTFSPPRNATENFNSIGQEQGLSLILYLEATNGTRNRAPYNYFTSVTNGVGARVTIHPPGTFPLPHYRGLDAMPGHSTSVSYKPQHIIRLGEPYGECKSSETGGSTYNALTCIGECRQRFLMNRCNCKTCFEPALNDTIYEQTPYCVNLPPGNEPEALILRNLTRTCLMDQWEGFEANKSSREGCGCAPRCDDYNYPYSVSESRWPAAQYFESFLQYELLARKDRLQLKAYNQLRTFIDNPAMIDNGTNYDFITDNFVRVNVYLSDMEVEVQEQQPSYRLSNLFSDIGGTLGLWVGLSLLTVVELIQLVFNLVALCGDKNTE